MTIIPRIFLGTIIVLIVVVSVFKITDIPFTDFLVILALCWGFIGVIEGIEELRKLKGK